MIKLTNQVAVAGALVAAVVVATGGYFLGVQPALAHADETDATAQATEAQAAQVQARVASLSRVAAKQGALEAQDVTLTKAVPRMLQANTFIRRVNTVAALDGVSVQSVTVGTATPYAPPAGVAAAAPAATTPTTATAAPSASPSASSSPAPATSAAAAGVAAAPVLAKTDPLITSASMTVIPMTLTVNGPKDAALRFVKDLQRDERTYLISGTTITVDPTGGTPTSTTVTGSVYALKG